MMDHSSDKQHADIEDIAVVVSKDLLLPVPQDDLLRSEEALHDWLVNQIGHLIDHDPNRLIQALYRIDVDENKVRTAFAEPHSTARSLAVYILERMKMKLESRKKYRASGKT